jgi:hypothetical protein
MFSRLTKMARPTIRSFTSQEITPICIFTGEFRNEQDCSCLYNCKGLPTIQNPPIDTEIIEVISYNDKQLQEDKLINKIKGYSCSEDKKIEIFRKKKLSLPKQYEYVLEEYKLVD